MHLPRYRHQLVLCKYSIYAIGGLARGKLATKQMECLSPQISENWKVREPMNYERKDFGATTFLDSYFIYVFGGTVGPHSHKDNKLIERYNTVENTWEVLDLDLEEEFNPFNTLTLVIQD